MEYNKYGYIRVSSKDQNVDRQITALKEVGLTGSQLYIDYQSGKDFNRPHYQKLLQVLKQGDILYIKSIDRLGRDYDEIIEQWRYYVAQIERENTRQRQAEGIREAKRRGVRFGRPKLTIPDDFEEIYYLWRKNVISKAEASRRLSTNNHTFTRWVKDYESI